jgi:predicted RNase H-like nuclease (RuvC/YqgF family)
VGLANNSHESEANARLASQIEKAASEKAALQEANRKLQAQNDELQQTNEELQAMVEVLRRKERGLVRTPQESPLTSPIVPYAQPNLTI